MLFDTHVNLHAEAFADDLVDVVARARSAGVTRMISICDKLENFSAIRAIVERQSDTWCSIGVHPHYARECPDLRVVDLVVPASWDRVCGIGETGLDQHYGYSDLEDQLKCFRTHIEASQETGLPLIVHTREADEETGDALEAGCAARPFPILMHCYTSGQKLAQRAMEMDAYFSVSGILSFRNAVAVREVISSVPADRIVLETDCPYLAPVPKRGRRNEPAFLPHVCEALAALWDRSVDDVAKVTTENALRLFGRVT